MMATTAVGLTTALAATPAHAVEPIVDDLGITAVTSFVVDTHHSHLLFGSGSASNGVVITDLSGNVQATVAAFGGINDISITPDGLYAFAASRALSKIYQINLATMAVTNTYSTPSRPPVSLAAVSDTVVAFGFDNGGNGGLGELTTSTSTPTITGITGPFDDDFTVRLEPNTTKVVAASTSSSMTYALVAQTTSGTPVVLNDTSSLSYGLPDCEFLNDLSVSPDDTTIAVACGGDALQREFSLADFSATATYPTTSDATAVAFSPNGQYLAAGMQSYDDNDLAVFNHTSTNVSPVYYLDYDDYDDAGTPSHGLAFSADGTQLYAIADDLEVSPHELYLVTLPVSSAPTFPPVSPPVAPPVAPPIAPPVTPPIGPVSTPVVQQAAQITVQAPPRTTIGVPYAITGTMHYANGLPAVGSTVTITTDVAGVAVSGTTTVSATGTFTDPVDPKKLGWTTVTASSAAVPAHYAASASTNTTVVKGAAKVTVKVAKLHGKVYVVTAHLTSFGVNRHVLISAGKKVIANLVANKAGLVSVKFTRKTKTVFTAVFTGDANDYPSRASVTLH